MLQPGSVLQERYKIVKVEKRKLVTPTYKAEHLSLDTIVAIRELSYFKEEEQFQQAVSLFKKEAKTTAGINHPNVVRIIDLFSEKNSWFLVMEYINGDSLEKILLNSPQPLTEKEVEEWAIKLCDILDFLHTRVPPIFFRMLSLDNIMISSMRGIKIIDLGIIREFNPGATPVSMMSHTQGFIAPELKDSRHSDERSDIYGLGMILYALLTKRDPRSSLFVYRPVKEINTMVSEKMNRVITRCLTKDPDKRYQSVRDLKRDILERSDTESLTAEEIAIDTETLAERTTTGKKKWVFLSFGSIHGSPAVGIDGTVYFGSTAKKLYAISPKGNKLWELQTGGGIYSSPAIDKDGTIYVACWDKNLYAISPSGVILWKFPTKEGARSTPAISPIGIIFIASRDNTLYAINKDGEKIWEMKFGGWIDSSPSLTISGILYIGSWDGSIYSIDWDGQKLWDFKTGGAINSSPAISYDGTIYVGSSDKRLYAFTWYGRNKWAVEVGAEIEISPVIDTNGNIIVCSKDRKIHCILPNGEILWEFETPDAITATPLITEKGSIYLGCGNRKFYAFDKEGTPIWEFKTDDNINCSPNVGYNGTVYIGTNDGKLYAISGNEVVASSPWPMFSHDPFHTSVVGINIVQQKQFL